MLTGLEAFVSPVNCILEIRLLVCVLKWFTLLDAPAILNESCLLRYMQEYPRRANECAIVVKVVPDREQVSLGVDDLDFVMLRTAQLGYVNTQCVSIR